MSNNIDNETYGQGLVPLSPSFPSILIYLCVNNAISDKKEMTEILKFTSAT